jgi:hypothetical protein
LDAYEIDIFRNRNKVRIYAKVGFKLVNLDVNYSFMLAKVRINLVVLTKKLESLNFVNLMFLKIFKGEFKPQGAKQPRDCILDSFNKILETLITINMCLYVSFCN